MNDKKRSEQEFDILRQKLRSALPPQSVSELRRDLWPRMLERMAQAPRPSLWPPQIPWFDWALLGAAAAAMIFFPALIPALLFHL